MNSLFVVVCVQISVVNGVVLGVVILVLLCMTAVVANVGRTCLVFYVVCVAMLMWLCVLISCCVVGFPPTSDQRRPNRHAFVKEQRRVCWHRSCVRWPCFWLLCLMGLFGYAVAAVDLMDASTNHVVEGVCSVVEHLSV